MVEKKDTILIGKVFGILSIVFAFISSWGIGGIILGIIGLNQIRNEKKSEIKNIRKLNIIGIIIGSVLFLISIVSLIVMVLNGTINLPNTFPVA